MTRSPVCVIMAKQPIVGRTKTRLSPPLTQQEASDLYEALLKDTIDLVAHQPGLDLALAITPSESGAYFKTIVPAGTLLIPVDAADIGGCLDQVFVHLLRFGSRKVLALNSDGPSLPADYLHQAVDALERHDLVLGPGHDGGYYLVGMTALHPHIFTGIDWSTHRVLSQTLQRAEELNLKVSLTPQWYDVDTAADMRRLAGELIQFAPKALAYTRKFLSTFDLERLDK